MDHRSNHKTLLKKTFNQSEHLRSLLKAVREAGGKAILVGGCVRDHLLDRVAEDIDIEVFGISVGDLEIALKKSFDVIAVGKSFGIFKVIITIDGDKRWFDVAVPRRESKRGLGHKGFMIDTDPHMTFAQASLRRDFTINAMGIDGDDLDRLLDPHGGEKDLENKLLRHVSDAFAEDPLRVLRAAQFCARFDLRLAPPTLQLCRSLKAELMTLSQERVYEEIKKLLLAKKPSIGLSILRDTEALILFPELHRLIDCPQEPKWHPEGDVWIHSLMVVDRAAELIAIAQDLDDDERLMVMAAALCHDLGKPATTIKKDGLIKSPGHEQAGEEPTVSFLTRSGFPKKLHQPVIELVKEHLKPFQLYAKRDEVGDTAIRRLSTRVNIKLLLLVAKADFLGRTTAEALSGFDPSAPWLKARVDEVLGEELSPQAILMGRHLIDLGLTPGKQFKKILDQAFEAQLEGEFSDEASAIKWIKQKFLTPKL